MKWLLCAILAVASVDWSQAMTVSEVPFEHSFYEMECPHPGDFQYWLLHGEGKALYAADTIEYEELTIFVNGSIIFKSIKIEFAGVHLCVRKDKETITAHPVPLKVRPLPPTNLWLEVYQSKFLTGFIAALMCFSLFALSCLVYNKRWRPVEKESDVTPIVGNGYDNPVMVEEDSSSTKM